MPEKPLLFENLNLKGILQLTLDAEKDFQTTAQVF
jgi:hypothetical protein